MINNDEDYLIRRTYINYGGSEMEEGYKELLSIEKEKTADEMFKELGYTKDLHLDKKEQVWGEYWTENKHCKKISFDYKDKEICVSTNYRLDITNEYEPLYFNIQDLQAINKKVEELGWNE